MKLSTAGPATTGGSVTNNSTVRGVSIPILTPGSTGATAMQHKENEKNDKSFSHIGANREGSSKSIIIIESG